MELSKKRRIASHTAVGAEFVRPGGVSSSSRLDAWLRLELVQKDALDEDRLAGSESLLGQASSRLSSEEGRVMTFSLPSAPYRPVKGSPSLGPGCSQMCGLIRRQRITPQISLPASLSSFRNK
ncbi:hypothetical protein FOZ60_014433 [Perkinsus olseni]|nr:hypothetical protein FOZ60_014433 [Perkinsus olseni]